MDDMSKKRENDQESPGMLLGPQERLICEQLVAGQPPYSQRAQSLLAIDAGATQKTAAQQSGLTVGQVSYWLSKFRKQGMSIFPEKLLLQIEPEPPIEKKEEKKEKSKKVKASKKAKKGKKNGKKKQGKKSKKRKKKKDKKK